MEDVGKDVGFDALGDSIWSSLTGDSAWDCASEVCYGSVWDYLKRQDQEDE